MVEVVLGRWSVCLCVFESIFVVRVEASEQHTYRERQIADRVLYENRKEKKKKKQKMPMNFKKLIAEFLRREICNKIKYR